MLSGVPENAPAESERTLLSSRGAWEHLELLGSTGEVYRSVWEVCVWLPDRSTFRWWRLCPLRLHMAKTSRHSCSNNSWRNSLWTRLPKEASEATGHPSLSQLTQLASNLANQDQTNTANQAVKDNCQAYHPHHGSQWVSLDASFRSPYASDAELWTTMRASALHTHKEVTQHDTTTRL